MTRKLKVIAKLSKEMDRLQKRWQQLLLRKSRVYAIPLEASK